MWLLETSIRQAIEAAKAMGFEPTGDQLRAFETAKPATESGDASRILSRTGDTATIDIKGVLTPTPDIFAVIFGGGNTTYQDITAAAIEAETNPDVKNVHFRINSGGGSVSGLFETIETIQSISKPTKTTFEGLGASAAFALGVQSDEVVAASKTTVLGSVGIVTEVEIDKSVVSITSTNAPNKRPDASTEEGQAVIREELDAFEELFISSISEGRGVSAEKVKKDFGKGGTVLAGNAVERGMIDAVEAGKNTITKTATSGKKAEVKNTMDLNELKAQHPETYAAAVELGASQESDRVQEHLILGEASGDMATAIEAVKSGTAMTGVLRATYMAASMKNRAIADFEADAADASAADAADESAPKAKDESDSVWAIVNEQLGVEA